MQEGAEGSAVVPSPAAVATTTDGDAKPAPKGPDRDGKRKEKGKNKGKDKGKDKGQEKETARQCHRLSQLGKLQARAVSIACRDALLDSGHANVFESPNSVDNGTNTDSAERERWHYGVFSKIVSKARDDQSADDLVFEVKEIVPLLLDEVDDKSGKRRDGRFARAPDTVVPLRRAMNILDDAEQQRKTQQNDEHRIVWRPSLRQIKAATLVQDLLKKFEDKVASDTESLKSTGLAEGKEFDDKVNGFKSNSRLAILGVTESEHKAAGVAVEAFFREEEKARDFSDCGDETPAATPGANGTSIETLTVTVSATPQVPANLGGMLDSAVNTQTTLDVRTVNVDVGHHDEVSPNSSSDNGVGEDDCGDFGDCNRPDTLSFDMAVNRGRHSLRCLCEKTERGPFDPIRFIRREFDLPPTDNFKSKTFAPLARPGEKTFVVELENTDDAFPLPATAAEPVIACRRCHEFPEAIVPPAPEKKQSPFFNIKGVLNHKQNIDPDYCPKLYHVVVKVGDGTKGKLADLARRLLLPIVFGTPKAKAKGGDKDDGCRQCSEDSRCQSCVESNLLEAEKCFLDELKEISTDPCCTPVQEDVFGKLAHCAEAAVDARATQVKTELMSLLSGSASGAGGAGGAGGGDDCIPPFAVGLLMVSAMAVNGHAHHSPLFVKRDRQLAERIENKPRDGPELDVLCTGLKNNKHPEEGRVFAIGASGQDGLRFDICNLGSSRNTRGTAVDVPAADCEDVVGASERAPSQTAVLQRKGVCTVMSSGVEPIDAELEKRSAGSLCSGTNDFDFEVPLLAIMVRAVESPIVTRKQVSVQADLVCILCKDACRVRRYSLDEDHRRCQLCHNRCVKVVALATHDGDNTSFQALLGVRRGNVLSVCGVGKVDRDFNDTQAMSPSLVTSPGRRKWAMGAGSDYICIKVDKAAPNSGVTIMPPTECLMCRLVVGAAFDDGIVGGLDEIAHKYLPHGSPAPIPIDFKDLLAKGKDKITGRSEQQEDQLLPVWRNEEKPKIAKCRETVADIFQHLFPFQLFTAYGKFAVDRTGDDLLTEILDPNSKDLKHPKCFPSEHSRKMGIPVLAIGKLIDSPPSKRENKEKMLFTTFVRSYIAPYFLRIDGTSAAATSPALARCYLVDTHGVLRTYECEISVENWEARTILYNVRKVSQWQTCLGLEEGRATKEEIKPEVVKDMFVKVQQVIDEIVRPKFVMWATLHKEDLFRYASWVDIPNTQLGKLSWSPWVLRFKKDLEFRFESRHVIIQLAQRANGRIPLTGPKSLLRRSTFKRYVKTAVFSSVNEVELAKFIGNHLLKHSPWVDVVDCNHDLGLVAVHWSQTTVEVADATKEQGAGKNKKGDKQVPRSEPSTESESKTMTTVYTGKWSLIVPASTMSDLGIDDPTDRSRYRVQWKKLIEAKGGIATHFDKFQMGTTETVVEMAPVKIVTHLGQPSYLLSGQRKSNPVEEGAGNRELVQAVNEGSVFVQIVNEQPPCLRMYPIHRRAGAVIKHTLAAERWGVRSDRPELEAKFKANQEKLWVRYKKYLEFVDDPSGANESRARDDFMRYFDLRHFWEQIPDLNKKVHPLNSRENAGDRSVPKIDPSSPDVVQGARRGGAGAGGRPDGGEVSTPNSAQSTGSVMSPPETPTALYRANTREGNTREGDQDGNQKAYCAKKEKSKTDQALLRDVGLYLSESQSQTLQGRSKLVVYAINHLQFFNDLEERYKVKVNISSQNHTNSPAHALRRQWFLRPMSDDDMAKLHDDATSTTKVENSSEFEPATHARVMSWNILAEEIYAKHPSPFPQFDGWKYRVKLMQEKIELHSRPSVICLQEVTVRKPWGPESLMVDIINSVEKWHSECLKTYGSDAEREQRARWTATIVGHEDDQDGSAKTLAGYLKHRDTLKKRTQWIDAGVPEKLLDAIDNQYEHSQSTDQGRKAPAHMDLQLLTMLKNLGYTVQFQLQDSQTGIAICWQDKWFTRDEEGTHHLVVDYFKDIQDRPVTTPSHALVGAGAGAGGSGADVGTDADADAGACSGAGGGNHFLKHTNIALITTLIHCETHRPLVVCCTHLKCPTAAIPKGVMGVQALVAAERLADVVQRVNTARGLECAAASVLCGDFNSEKTDPGFCILEDHEATLERWRDPDNNNRFYEILSDDGLGILDEKQREALWDAVVDRVVPRKGPVRIVRRLGLKSACSPEFTNVDRQLLTNASQGTSEELEFSKLLSGQESILPPRPKSCSRKTLTLDYIFASKHSIVKDVSTNLKKNDINKWGIPNSVHPSDHIPVVADVNITDTLPDLDRDLSRAGSKSSFGRAGSADSAY